MSETDDQNFLSRWSRRKAAIAAGEDVIDVHPALATTEPVSNEPDEARLKELEENRMAAEAIDVESLNYESDFSMFLKDGVPSLLRQKAMRILWRSNPLLANVDGLCDYDENFADPSMILKTFESAYKIGKGYIFEEEEDGEEETSVASGDIDDEGAVSKPEETEEVSQATLDTAENKEEEPLENVADITIDTPSAATSFDDVNMITEPVPIERPRVSLRQRLQFDAG